MEQEGRVMMSAEMIKTCPFCGSKGEIKCKKNLKTWIVECTNNDCPASYMIGNDYETAEDAIEAWNRRAGG